MKALCGRPSFQKYYALFKFIPERREKCISLKTAVSFQLQSRDSVQFPTEILLILFHSRVKGCARAGQECRDNFFLRYLKPTIL